MQQPFHVRKVAVLGAGVMGAQIAAHCINSKVPVVLFELPAKEGDPNGLVRKALDGLAKIDPSPIATGDAASQIVAANYEQHIELLGECDLVIEAIAERMDWKKSLYDKVTPHLAEHAIFASNTSGLSIAELAAAVPANLRTRFCGVHFFNPPRYMHLVELIAHAGTDAKVLDQLEAFLTTTLGKGVIRAKDTPNFIANRVGIFSMLATMHHCVKFGLGFDTVDALTGPAIGRPKSATFRTADVVGLDTMAHVINTMRDTLPTDPWHFLYTVPAWLKALIDKGALGQKTKIGIYRKPAKDIEVLDLNRQDYRLSAGEVDDETKEILGIKNPAEQMAKLRGAKSPQAQFLWACFRDVFHYSAVHLESIADNARDLDLAIRWGFGWKTGPFEIWQAAGWSQIAHRINEDIAAGKALAKAPLPAWVTEPDRRGVHSPAGSWSPKAKGNMPRSSLAVYKRQPYPDLLLGETRDRGATVFETEAVRCWTSGDDIAVVTFKSKMHSIGADVLDGVQQSIAEAEKNFKALIIWQDEAPFSVGANLSSGGGAKKADQKPSAFGSMFKKLKREATSMALKAAYKLNVADKLMAAKLEEVEALVANFQHTSQALKYSMVPTVAAADGLALGGGCEFIMHCDRAVATLESYIGLVEVGVGLLPAGGGLKELAQRAAREAKGNDIFQFLRNYFQNVATAQVSKSAEQARELGYLRPSDRVIANRFELLYVAKQEAQALAEAGYRPPLPARNIAVLGKTGIATLKAGMVNMLAGGFISQHDFLIGSKIAHVMCGGEVEAGSLVDEDWLLDLEREAFIELAATEKTQERIQAMLKTGKPLRN